jgi:hypothetical protein
MELKGDEEKFRVGLESSLRKGCRFSPENGTNLQ